MVHSRCLGLQRVLCSGLPKDEMAKDRAVAHLTESA